MQTARLIGYTGKFQAGSPELAGTRLCPNILRHCLMLHSTCRTHQQNCRLSQRSLQLRHHKRLRFTSERVICLEQYESCSPRAFSTRLPKYFSCFQFTEYPALDKVPAWSLAFSVGGHAQQDCKEHFHNSTGQNGKQNDGKYHEWQNKHSPFQSKLNTILASLGVAFIVYENLSENSILPSAACLSWETVAASKSPELQRTVDRSSSTLEPSYQKKIGADKNDHGRISLTAAVKKAQELCQRRKDEVGSPGLVVCVSVDGKQVYAEGFGYADLENRIPMTSRSVLRIASISKAMTAAVVAKMWEKGQVDIEKPVQHYVPSFPQKEFLGEKVEITVQQLLNHTSGIRHYKSKDDPAYSQDQPIAKMLGVVRAASQQPFYVVGPKAAADQDSKKKASKKEEDRTATDTALSKKELTEMEREEYYLTRYFPTTAESLALFQDDPLMAKPGTRFVYTTFAYTLLAAVVEAISTRPFTEVLLRTLQHWGLKETYLDLNDPIIYNRARNYVKNDSGNIVNAPYVDLSYKWAGGGLLSSAEDVVKFGNILLYSAQHKDSDSGLPGFLKSSTISKFWEPQAKKGASRMYGLGFELTPAKEHYGMCEHHSFGVGHTGAAVGMSSALFILPRRGTTVHMGDNSGGQGPLPGLDTSVQQKRPTATNTKSKTSESKSILYTASDKSEKLEFSPTSATLPQGVVVAVFINMIGVSVRDTAEQIARTFEDVDFCL